MYTCVYSTYYMYVSRFSVAIIHIVSAYLLRWCVASFWLWLSLPPSSPEGFARMIGVVEDDARGSHNGRQSLVFLLLLLLHHFHFPRTFQGEWCCYLLLLLLSILILFSFYLPCSATRILFPPPPRNFRLNPIPLLPAAKISKRTFYSSLANVVTSSSAGQNSTTSITFE